MTHSKTYQVWLETLKEVEQLGEIMGLLTWDQETMMPKGSIESRSKQKSALAGIIHEKFTSPELGEMAEKIQHELNNQNNEDPIANANLREFFRVYRRQTRVPKKLVQALSAAETKGHAVWNEALEKNDYRVFKPILKELVSLTREQSQAIDDSKPEYDVQLEKYEVGVSSAQISKLFDALKNQLIPFIGQIKDSENKPDESILTGSFPQPKQHEFAVKIAKAMGFDFKRGRMDISVHPFCGGCGPNDVRMTTRYRDNNFTESLTGIIHETGHALYEQGRNSNYAHEPVSDARSMGVHESQSLLWEKRVGLSYEFWQHFFPVAQKHFAPHLDSVSLDQFHRAINAVNPSFIRVEADEVTYPMHVILRFELEKSLLENEDEFNDLPERWNQKMKEYLGIVPADDRQGVLQDVHWSAGLFGYFPTYNLGALYSSQIFETAKKTIPDLLQNIAKGNFLELKKWLNTEVHEKGSLWETTQLIQEITGEEINPKIHMQYLKDKYSTLYDL